MPQFYVLCLMAWLLKQQSRYPGGNCKSTTDESLLEMMQVQWSQESLAKVCPDNFGVPTVCLGVFLSGENLAHPDRRVAPI